MEKRLERLEKTVEKLQQLETLKNTVESLTLDVEKLKELETLKNTVDHIVLELKQLKDTTQLETLENTVESLTLDVEKLKELETLKNTVESLTLDVEKLQQLETLKNTVESLTLDVEKLQQLETLKTTVEHIILELKQLKDNKKEQYYQKFLEKQLSATHGKTQFGITDITTKNSIIEIKRWPDYKTAIGQLLAYAFTSHKKLVIYFFGAFTSSQRNNAIELCRHNNITIFEFIEKADGTAINLVFDACNTPQTLSDFRSFINERIEFCEGSCLHFDVLCQQYYKRFHTTAEQKAILVESLDRYVKDNFYRAKVKRMKDRWVNLHFYNADDPFIKWLDQNVVIEKDSILKLTESCERFSGKKIGVKTASAYKPIMEQFVKHKFSQYDINYHYQTCTYNGINFKGWLHLRLKDS